jgi:Cu+-exporting ATPase
MDIDPKNAAATEEYQKKTYHFCSAACHEKFKAAPEKYV